MATMSKKSYSRFQGLLDDDVASDDGSDAISDARYKQYIQIIYTPVSLHFCLFYCVYQGIRLHLEKFKITVFE